MVPSREPIGAGACRTLRPREEVMVLRSRVAGTGDAEGDSAKRSPHRRDIQGLRAFAVVVVVLNHAFPDMFPGGYIGVDVFFVISGFVITGLIRRGLISGNFSFKQFYVRRIYRLFPALAVFVAGTAVLSALFVSPVGIQAQSAVTGLAAVFWMSNFSLWYFSSDYFSPHVQMNPYLHTWSLGVEEQFYILFPAVLVAASAVMARRGRSRLSASIVVAFLSVASLAFAVACTYGWFQGIRGAESFAFYSVFTRIWEFGVGALLALALESGRRASARTATVLGSGGLVVLLASVVVFTESTPFPGYLALVPVLGAALVIGAGPHGPVSSLLSLRPVVHLGDVSYSWYLWHWPFIVIGKRMIGDSIPALLLLVALSYLAALGSYTFVEQRWRHRVGNAGLRRLVPVIPMLLVPAVAAGVLGVGGQTSWRNTAVSESTAELKPRPAKSGLCGGFQGPMSTRDVSQCTWGADRPGPPIYLMGDSNAGQFTEALVAASEELDRPLIVATRGGCPFVDARTRAAGSVGLDAQECHAWFDDAKTWLEDQEPGTVVLAAAGEAVTDDAIELQDSSGDWISEEAAKEKAWRAGALASVEAVKSAGHSTLVVGPIPHLTGEGRPWWHPAECANVHWFQRDPEACDRSVSVPEYRSSQAVDRSVARASAQSVDGVYLDLEDELCTNGHCSAFRDGHWWYRDGLHISTYGSAQLADPFVRALESAST